MRSLENENENENENEDENEKGPGTAARRSTAEGAEMTCRAGESGTGAHGGRTPGGWVPVAGARPRRAVRRGVAAALTACVLTAAAPAGGAVAAPQPSVGAETAAAVRSGGPLPDGVHGPVVTHPVQQPVDYPPGEVCPFAAHADFPVNDLTMRTWYDDEGNPVFATESGPLVMDVTNLASGRTVTRDISGSGTITYLDADSYILSGGDWGAGFHTADRPVHNRWIISRGSMSVQITNRDGTSSRRLLDLRGPYEDLCETLGG